MNRKRYLEDYIASLCFSKNLMAFVSGPRQSGKTTMAKMMLKDRKSGEYYNWDETTFRRLWAKDPSNVIPKKKKHIKPLIILDEIHKVKLWKRNLKGIYDTLQIPCDILVTGSARLKVYQKGGDSLMGRYFPFRLHPFSIAELLHSRECLPPDQFVEALFDGSFKSTKSTRQVLESLLQFGPFPAPLLDGTKRYLRLWRKNRIDQVIREDLRDLSRLPELSEIEMLVSLLPERVSNLLSITSLTEILEVSYPTIKRWLHYLRALYFHFELKPYTRSISRSYKKMSKLYLWDWSEVEDESRRFENLIAFHLLKYCQFLSDTGEGVFELRYLRSRDHHEIDFLIIREGKPWLPIEIKLNRDQPSKNWNYFLKRLNCKRGVQLTKKRNINKLLYIGDAELLIVSADLFLSHLI